MHSPLCVCFEYTKILTAHPYICIQKISRNIHFDMFYCIDLYTFLSFLSKVSEPDPGDTGGMCTLPTVTATIFQGVFVAVLLTRQRLTILKYVFILCHPSPIFAKSYIRPCYIILLEPFGFCSAYETYCVGLFPRVV